MKNLTQYRELLKFPTDEDLTGAATALIRLQDTYKLDTASVARGELNGIQYSTQLSGKYITVNTFYFQSFKISYKCLFLF